MIWEIDSSRSRGSFALRVMSVTTTRGSFNALRGQLHIDEQTPANSWVEAEVDAASIHTHNILRDTHLRSNAFFATSRDATTRAMEDPTARRMSPSVTETRRSRSHRARSATSRREREGL